MGNPTTGRLFKIVAGAALAFAVAAFLIAPPALILVMNGLLLSVSAGVMVAYAPVLVGALGAKVPTKGDFLGAGVFFGWLGVCGNRILSLIGRDIGYPEIYNTHAASTFVAVSLVGGMLHLWAPAAIEGRLPRERWIMTGVVVAVGCAIVFAAWTTHMRVIHRPVLLQ